MRRNNRAAFSLLEMSLVLFIVSGSLLLGSKVQTNKYNDFAERAAIHEFSNLYQQAMTYSLTHRKGFKFKNEPLSQPKRINFLFLNGDKLGSVMFPPTMKLPKHLNKAIVIKDGKIKRPVELLFIGAHQTYRLTIQMYWGRLLVK